ncbi:MAG: SciE type virulence protein [Candidatus Nealsonbacteria bacterium]|nr:SciE type virulence protein [Candidatus Nealsonbacteria bacterium]
MKAKELYEAGKLNDAVAAAIEEVRRHPTNAAHRWLLCELLCFAGELERVDKHLDLMATQDPKMVAPLSLFRQLIRAEQARVDFYGEGRLPEFMGKPSAGLQLCLEASIRTREGKSDEAAALLQQAEEQRTPVVGNSGGKPFDDLRDMDDMTAPFLEVFTSTGKYFWIPIESIRRIEFRKPERLGDLLWRRANLAVCGGPDGEVFLPTRYAGSHEEPDDDVRLGRATDWRGDDGCPVRGVGQRMFMVGQQDLGILEIEDFDVSNPVSLSTDDPTQA